MKVKLEDENDYDLVVCPSCGSNNTHQSSPVEFWGVGNSGEGVSIRFLCECCPKEWDLSIQQHKGLTMIETFGVNEENKRRIYERGELDGKLIRIYGSWGYRKLIYSHYEPNNTHAKTLRKALLEGIDLKYTHFIEKDFSHADLRGLNLSGIDFTRCNMRNVNLLGASFGAGFYATSFSSSDLTGAKYNEEQMALVPEDCKPEKLSLGE